jgi:HSP20 family protein
MARDVGRRQSDPVFERLERQMDDLVSELFRRPAAAAYRRAWTPRVGVDETTDALVAVAELGGVDPSGVTIEVEGDQITITGGRSPTAPPEGSECLQLEIPFGAFERTLVLPAPVDAGGAKADFDNGILSLHLPKLTQAPTRVQVNVEGPPDE